MKGSKLAKELVDSSKFTVPKRLDLCKKQKLVENHYKNKIATKVGELLGHKKTNKDSGKTEPVGTTAIKNYINPNITKEFFDKHNVRAPAWLQSLLKGKDSE